MRRFTPLLLFVLAACSAGGARLGSLPATSTSMAQGVHSDHQTAASRLKHVVIIIQENRSMDNMFNGFCVPGTGKCADTVTTDPVTGTPLVQQSMAAPFTPSHVHDQFVTQYDNGKMDGWAGSTINCKKHHTCDYTVFDYVPSSETQLYQDMATYDGVMADETHETPMGPSYPAHLYAIAGQSGGYDTDHLAMENGYGDCGTKADVAEQIDMTTAYPGVEGDKTVPCKDFPTIFDLLTAAGHTWRYYSNKQASFWSATQSIQHLYNSPNLIVPSTKFLTDLASGSFADVTYIMPPTPGQSDHPLEVKDPQAGPEWVTSVVNAIGQSPYWDHTAIVVYWDDWGGFYDHVLPKFAFDPFLTSGNDPFEYGFRVPMIVISPYAKLGTIDNTERTTVGTLRLIEAVFGLPSLGTTDLQEPDALDATMDYKKRPRAFVPITGSGAHPYRQPR
jgi:phospholipase C